MTGAGQALPGWKTSLPPSTAWATEDHGVSVWSVRHEETESPRRLGQEIAIVTESLSPLVQL